MILGSVPHPHIIQSKFETNLEVSMGLVVVYICVQH